MSVGHSHHPPRVAPRPSEEAEVCAETWGALEINARQGLKWGTGARICVGGWGVAPVTKKLGLGTLCLFLSFFPDPQLSLGHPSLPGLCTSRGTFLLDLSTSTRAMAPSVYIARVLHGVWYRASITKCWLNPRSDNQELQGPWSWGI